MLNLEQTAAQLPADATLSDRKILILPIATIKHTPYNPANRTKEGATFSRLIESVRKNGLAYPVLITKHRDVIDGNRRLAACRTLGHQTVECLVSICDRDEAFTMVNITALPIGGKGWLEIGKGGGYLPATKAAQYAELQKLVGNYGVDLLIRQNIGLNVLSLCKSVAALGVKQGLGELILMTAKHRLTNKLNTEIRSGKTLPEKVEAVHALLKAVA